MGMPLLHRDNCALRGGVFDDDSNDDTSIIYSIAMMQLYVVQWLSNNYFSVQLYTIYRCIVIYITFWTLVIGYLKGHFHDSL